MNPADRGTPLLRWLFWHREEAWTLRMTRPGGHLRYQVWHRAHALVARRTTGGDR